jgi:MFS family permease
MFQIAGTILSNLVYNFIAKHYDARLIVKTCIFIGGFTPLAALFLARFGPEAFSLVFLMMGFMQSGRRIGFESYLLDIAPDGERTVYLGIRGSLNIGAVLLPVLGGTFIELLGYPATFMIVSPVMFAAAVLLQKPKTKA